MKRTAMRGGTLEPWLRELAPARITVLDCKTGARFTEPSYVAAEYETVETTGRDPAAGGPRTFPHLTLRRYLAAGRESLRYEGSPNVLAFSPFRDGQVAQYDGADHPGGGASPHRPGHPLRRGEGLPLPGAPLRP